MFWKRKSKVKATELADIVMTESVEKPFSNVPHFDLTPESKLAYGAKTRLYQFASVMLAVMIEEKNNAKYTLVREQLERNFFPETYQQSANMLDEVRSAMRDLSELLQPNDSKKHLYWAQKWLSTIGVDESNPVTLHLFAVRWCDHFIAINESIRKFRDSVEVV